MHSFCVSNCGKSQANGVYTKFKRQGYANSFHYVISRNITSGVWSIRSDTNEVQYVCLDVESLTVPLGGHWICIFGTMPKPTFQQTQQKQNRKRKRKHFGSNESFCPRSEAQYSHSFPQSKKQKVMNEVQQSLQDLELTPKKNEEQSMQDSKLTQDGRTISYFTTEELDNLPIDDLFTEIDNDQSQDNSIQTFDAIPISDMLNEIHGATTQASKVSGHKRNRNPTKPQEPLHKKQKTNVHDQIHQNLQSD